MLSANPGVNGCPVTRLVDLPVWVPAFSPLFQVVIRVARGGVDIPKIGKGAFINDVTHLCEGL